MPQTTSEERLNNEIEPSPELIDRVYEYIKAQQPCHVRDVIDAMRQFFPGNPTRDEIKPLVIKALNILTNEEKRVFIGCIPPDRELSFVYVINN